MLRPAAAALLALSTLGVATPPAPREVIDIGVEDAAAPWSQPDGTGYANDVARAAFAAAGIDVRMQVLPYARCKQLVVTGALVACVSMSPAPELRGVVRFSARPLFVFTCDFFEGPARRLPPRITELARGTRVGIVLGYEYPEAMLAPLRARGAVLEPAPTEEINLRKLAAGRLHAAVVNRDQIKSPDWVAARAGVTGRVRSVFQIGSMPGYVGFSTAHRDGVALATRFDAGHTRVVESGELARIQRRWMARNATRARR